MLVLRCQFHHNGTMQGSVVMIYEKATGDSCLRAPCLSFFLMTSMVSPKECSGLVCPRRTRAARDRVMADRLLQLRDKQSRDRCR
jgi:hypothetical protein